MESQPDWIDDTSLVEARTRLESACPTFAPQRTIRRTGKSLVVEGQYQGIRAVAKLLLENGEFWQERLRQELTFYAATQDTPPPVTIPKFLYGDRDAGVLVIQHLTGQPLAHERYPNLPVDAAGFSQLLVALPPLHAWQPWASPSRMDVVQESRQRLDKHLTRGLITAEDAQQVAAMIDITEWEPEFHHRDLLFSNCLIDEHRLAIVDWEYGGYAVPGYDQALVWTLLMDHEAQRDMLREAIHASGSAAMSLFAANLMVVLPREMHLLRETAIEAFQRRATRLETELDTVRNWLRAHSP